MFEEKNIYQLPKGATNPHWEEQEDVLVEDEVFSGLPVHIIVWNDDVNPFEWVIMSFMEVLQHTHEQADQLALIIHHKGRAIVKTGPKSELVPMCEALQDRGLSAEIEGDEADS